MIISSFKSAFRKLRLTIMCFQFLGLLVNIKSVFMMIMRPYTFIVFNKLVCKIPRLVLAFLMRKVRVRRMNDLYKKSRYFDVVSVFMEYTAHLFFLSFLIFVMLGMEPKTSHMLSK